MLVLGLDTSTPAVTVAVAEVAGGDRVVALASRCDVAVNRHGELLTPAVAEVLATAGCRPQQLSGIAVGLGPGPFTGLRVGIVTAAAMGDALAIPVYGGCSLDAVPRPAGTVAVLTDARRRQVYWAAYREHERLTEPDLGVPGELVPRLVELGVTVARGAGAIQYRDRLEGIAVDEREPYPSAIALVTLLADRVRSGAPGDDLSPLYLRRPDATPPGRPKQVTPA